MRKEIGCPRPSDLSLIHLAKYFELGIYLFFFMEEMNGHTQSKKSFKAYKIGLQNYFSCLPVEMKFESWMKS